MKVSIVVAFAALLLVETTSLGQAQSTFKVGRYVSGRSYVEVETPTRLHVVLDVFGSRCEGACIMDHIYDVPPNYHNTTFTPNQGQCFGTAICGGMPISYGCTKDWPPAAFSQPNGSIVIGSFPGGKVTFTFTSPFEFTSAAPPLNRGILRAMRSHLVRGNSGK
jgi:hypothetical protein